VASDLRGAQLAWAVFLLAAGLAFLLAVAVVILLVLLLWH